MTDTKQLWTTWPWTLTLGCLLVGVAMADPPEISDPSMQLPTGTEVPGTFPETVTAANVNIAPVAGSVLGGTGSNDLLVTLPASGPIAWTDSRHNEGDIALNIGPFDPNDASYFPPTTHGEWKPLSGEPFSNATLSWRVNNQHGALLASVRHNGVDNQDTFGGTAVGTTHGVANFIVGSSQGWGFRMNDGEFANGGNGSSDLIMGMAGADMQQSEASFNVAAASFPYAEGWLGAWVDADNGGEATFAASHPDVLTSSVNWANGSARVVLPGVDSATDGMLFVSPSNGSSTTKIAAGAPRAGGWDVSVRFDQDEDTTGLTFAPASDFQFLYVPYDANDLMGGHVNGGDASLVNSAGSDRFSLSRNGDGEYALSVFETDLGVTKLTEDDGMLVLSVAGQMAGTTDAADRTFLSYEYDAGSGDFIIQSRDVAAISSPNSENQFGDWLKLRDSNFYFAFVDFSDPLNLGAALPGDFNGDNIVNAADYTVWRDNLGAADESSLGGNGDGLNGVNEADYALWKASFGNTAGSGSGSLLSATVPEPSTVFLLLAFGCLMGCPYAGRTYRHAEKKHA